MANGLAGSPISVPLKTAKQLKHKKKIECSKRDGNNDKTRCFSSYDLTCKTAKLPRIFWKWALKQNENVKISRLILNSFFFWKFIFPLFLGEYNEKYRTIFWDQNNLMFQDQSEKYKINSKIWASIWNKLVSSLNVSNLVKYWQWQRKLGCFAWL